MNDTTTRESGAALLARIKPRLREESVLICLRGDLLNDWQAAQDKLAEVEEETTAPTRRLGQGNKAELIALAEAVKALEDEIDASQVRFTFRAMPKDEWSELTDQHPPREGNMPDQFGGYNRDAVSEAAIRQSLVDPVFEDCTDPTCTHDIDLDTGESCGSWQALVKVLNPTEWDALKSTCNLANGMLQAPKSLLASEILSRRSSDSEQPEPSE